MRRVPEWEQTVARLVDERGDALLRYAQLLCGDREDAADLVQDALVRTFGRLRNGFSIESAESYVRRAILNGAVDRSLGFDKRDSVGHGWRGAKNRCTGFLKSLAHILGQDVFILHDKNLPATQ